MGWGGGGNVGDDGGSEHHLLCLRHRRLPINLRRGNSALRYRTLLIPFPLRINVTIVVVVVVVIFPDVDFITFDAGDAARFRAASIEVMEQLANGVLRSESVE